MFLTKHIYPRLGIKFSRLCFALTAVQVAVVHLHVIYTQRSIREELEANILYEKERACDNMITTLMFTSGSTVQQRIIFPQ